MTTPVLLVDGPASAAGGEVDDPDHIRADFRNGHPYCALVEVWRERDGESALLQAECGSPAEHQPAPINVRTGGGGEHQRCAVPS